MCRRKLLRPHRRRRADRTALHVAGLRSSRWSRALTARRCVARPSRAVRCPGPPASQAVRQSAAGRATQRRPWRGSRREHLPSRQTMQMAQVLRESRLTVPSVQGRPREAAQGQPLGQGPAPPAPARWSLPAPESLQAASVRWDRAPGSLARSPCVRAEPAADRSADHGRGSAAPAEHSAGSAAAGGPGRRRSPWAHPTTARRASEAGRSAGRVRRARVHIPQQKHDAGRICVPRREFQVVPARGRPIAVQTAAAIFSAFLRASSRVPTYMNALSGRLSPSPLQMRSKLSIVSSRLVVTPGRPVNTSPT